ncbi:undecaprenyl-diphosphate phosphatase [Phreatobacter oligotrophus]|jgi:undecaprenyl-diphosphatase|uniref:Undecaprenyl-diphosphatase n=1 Tax=Phreatobacter oligotrophus TaxID=1122261 RepID=A0A2T4Z005_9HYPH|nr:undecaprenyl-diphosphate phosphatase [Phreatobacter oligotrophus]MBX9990062.1 undecaprenyl-diphosphate phosphatase [Phreatobacter oligotrophus]PTM52824.1 undecaprenyl-diphosphatase [Phreatobacter oligotrophus]
MDIVNLAKALVLGVVEGATEFIPVSSTGHLILIGHFLGFQSTGKTFEVLIQLGAILAILLVYFTRLLGVVLCLPTDAWARRFVASVLIAFLPAALLGAVLHSRIKAVFERPDLVCVALILGGIVLLVVDRLKLEAREDNAFRFSPMLALKIGLCQCAALFPGVSRSGATIVGALLMGTTKRAAAEFSFFLAMPTMAGAFAYDLYKNYKVLDFADVSTIAVGFVAAFISGLFVVRFLLDYVSRHGFGLFAVWRIVVGAAGLAGLYFIG